jgi:hypothetical protein
MKVVAFDDSENLLDKERLLSAKLYTELTQ